MEVSQHKCLVSAIEYTSHVNGPSTGQVLTNPFEDSGIHPPHDAGATGSWNSLAT